jgi:hypothetical protein
MEKTREFHGKRHETQSRLSKTRGERERETRENSSKEQKCSGTPRQTIFKLLEHLEIQYLSMQFISLFKFTTRN